MIYWVIIWSVVLFFVLPMDVIAAYGVSNTNLPGCLYYMYMHSSWLHLFINVLSLSLMWFPVRKVYTLRYNEETYALNAATFVAAVIAGLACAAPTPTVGMSGMVYFLLGTLIVLNPTKAQLMAYIPIALVIIMQFFLGHSNVALHIFAFIEGFIYMCIREFLYQYKNRLNSEC